MQNLPWKEEEKHSFGCRFSLAFFALFGWKIAVVVCGGWNFRAQTRVLVMLNLVFILVELISNDVATLVDVSFHVVCIIAKQECGSRFDTSMS